ncbi:PREDICTED: lysine-rich nucleolar protein 1, partial [Pterocles gutturalis]|uniref:lysine-rich nucleolar protein 1 n=1 Tax=Pterocles gutturalis TaxID=240206 RepID=UPI0005284A9D
KKRKEVYEEPEQKKLKSSRSQTVITIEEDVQTVIKSKDDGPLETKTKVRKKEKSKEDECLDEVELKKKKNKKRRVASQLLEEAHSESFVNVEGHLDSESQEESEEQVKILKKKKKKAKGHSSVSLENNQSSDVEFSNHHTDGTKENEIAFRKSTKNTALNVELDGEVTKKKKKKGIFSLALEDIQDSEHKQTEKVHKKPDKYISQEEAFTGQTHGTGIIQNEEESYVRRKKRKKKKDKPDTFLPLADHQDNVYGIPDNPIALRDFRKNFQDVTLTNREEEDTTENSGSIRETKRKKKRSKDVSSLTCEDNKDFSHRVPGKHLPAQQEVELEEEELSGKKSRKNSKNNNEECGDDVTIVQEKKGNCDEVNIDKVRRQALQEEIDRESGKTKVFSPKVEQDAKFGQWSTAAFKSSEEQMKFFKLMGGFKKGSVPSQNLSATTNKPNMALNREGEEKLQQALKMEFDKAMDLKQHKGTGLGFQPAANKKGYIDKYTSRSIKFED